MAVVLAVAARQAQSAVVAVAVAVAALPGPSWQRRTLARRLPLPLAPQVSAARP
ncbi:MAG TPA: hypothetical protein VK453_25360 [Micromonosporaceae bacterium]|nr:hypothetical protein [Micromonosporaceae bacterium]